MQPGSSPLDQLADIHLPDSVSWWPLAPGWWILLGLLICIIIALVLWQKKKIKHLYRLHALELLQQAYARYQTDQQAALYLQQLSEILRRVARTSYGSLFNPSIKGEDWLHWLDLSCPSLKHKFASDCGRILLSGPYQKNPQAKLEELHQVSLEWIRNHQTHKAMRKLLQQVSSGEPTNTNEVRQHV